jgi:hypothetical protein
MIGDAVDMPIRLELLRLPGMAPGRCDEIAEGILIADEVVSVAS